MSSIYSLPNQHDSGPALQEFHKWLSNEAKCSGTLSPISAEKHHDFVPYTRMKEYLSNAGRTHRILEELFPEKWDEMCMKWSEEIRSGYCRVFSILLHIGEGRFIEEFVKHRKLRDECLPFTNSDGFPGTSTARSEFFNRFNEAQWIFCPAEFSNMHNGTKVLDEKEVLPVISKRKLGRGGCASVYQIKLHSAYNGLHGTGTLPQDPEDDSQDIFVLKTYTKQYRGRQYQAEVDAFLRLRKHKDLHSFIGFFGSFEQGQTFNIILQYAAGGTLEDFFQSNEPPRTPQDIFAFWRGLMEILHGLKFIHQVKDFENSRNSQPLQGWHQDVKPANILVVPVPGKSIFESQFKLADLGLCHFRRDTRDKDIGGTRTYGAPECSRSSPIEANTPRLVNNSIDVWSFACVCSEACQWLLWKREGLGLYRDRRCMATDYDPTFPDRSAFHYEGQVLDCVTRTHHEVEDNIRRFDPWITPKILEMVGEMMHPSPSRPSAEFFYNGKWESFLKLLQRQSTGRDSLNLRPTSPSFQNPTLATFHKTENYLQSRPSDTNGKIELPTDVSPPIPSKQRTVMKAPDRKRSQNGKQPPIPHLTVQQAKEWRDSRRKKDGTARLPDDYYASYLERRDIIILIDDSGSMRGHKSEMLTLLDILTYILKSKDPNKMELLFTMDRSDECLQKHSTPLVNTVKRHFDRVESSTSRMSNMERRLEIFVKAYIQKLKGESKTGVLGRLHNHASIRPISIYILTDAEWQPYSDAAEPIRELVGALDELEKPKEQVSVQFIQFGDDPRGTERLKKLDNGLELSRDIVDSAPSDGNVWKMLLGGLIPWFDRSSRSPSNASQSSLERSGTT